MKVLFIFALLAIVSCANTNIRASKSSPLDGFRCLFASETLQNILSKITEAADKNDLPKLLVEVIRLLPNAIKEAKRCFNEETVNTDGTSLINNLEEEKEKLEEN